MNSSRILSGIVVCAALACLPQVAMAQKPAGLPGDYPAKPVRILIGLAAGGGVDTVVRAMSGKLSEKWGTPMIVENRPSTGGLVAMDILAKSPPDGYNWLASGTQLELGVTYHRVTKVKVKEGYAPSFDAMKVFDPIVQMNTQPYLLIVHTSLPIKSVKELIAYAKSKPGEMTYATPGIGSSVQIGQEYFNSLFGIKMTHIPYKGGGAALADLAAGRVQESFLTTLTAINLVKRGSVRALAVTSQKRLEAMPDVPTVSEAAGVPDFEMTNAYGLFARGGTPAAILTAINRDVLQVMNQPDMKAKLAADGAEPGPVQTPAQYRAKVEANIKRWIGVVEASGITPE
jgi:tripartite-type tricarboxylate transporter receptor subunit TctC